MKCLTKLSLLTIIGAAFMASPAIADEASELEAAGVAVWKMLPRPSEMIRHPGADSYEFYGTKSKSKQVSAKDIPGDKASQIKIRSAGANPWDVGANVKTQLATKQGDVLVAVIYARAKKLPEGQSEAVLPIHIQEQGGAYKQYGSSEARLTEAWSRHVVYGTLDRNFKKGAVGAAIHLATGKQTIELGPVYLMNMGSGSVEGVSIPAG